jgi:hypothetical protein
VGVVQPVAQVESASIVWTTFVVASIHSLFEIFR